MKRPYVERLRVQNYGCVQDCELTLSPLHALVGPNDSGKSTLLAALETLGLVAACRVDQSKPARWVALEQRLRASNGRGPVRLGVVTAKSSWDVEYDESNWFERLGPPPADALRKFHLSFGSWMDPSSGTPLWPRQDRVLAAIGGVTVLRLDPDEMRKPTALIQEGMPWRFETDRGLGLASVYDCIFGQRLDAAVEITNRLRGLFPSLKYLKLTNFSTNAKTIGAVLEDGTEVAAAQLSEGLLYYLALAALPHLAPTPLVLIEEPENGLHPARIAKVVEVLRAASRSTQIVLATHSPLVINELQAHEVSVITRDRDAGTKAVLLKDTPNYEARSKAYANGELWLNYCDGEAEAPLVQGGPRP